VSNIDWIASKHSFPVKKYIITGTLAFEGRILHVCNTYKDGANGQAAPSIKMKSLSPLLRAFTCIPSGYASEYEGGGCVGNTDDCVLGTAKRTSYCCSLARNISAGARYTSAPWWQQAAVVPRSVEHRLCSTVFAFQAMNEHRDFRATHWP